MSLGERQDSLSSFQRLLSTVHMLLSDFESCQSSVAPNRSSFLEYGGYGFETEFDQNAIRLSGILSVDNTR